MQELHIFITEALVKILKAQVHHADQSVKSDKFSKEVKCSIIIPLLTWEFSRLGWSLNFAEPTF